MFFLMNPLYCGFEISTECVLKIVVNRFKQYILDIKLFNILYYTKYFNKIFKISFKIFFILWILFGVPREKIKCFIFE